MKLIKKIVLACIAAAVLTAAMIPLLTGAEQSELTAEKLSSFESFNVFDFETADAAMGFFPSASTSVKFGYSTAAGTFNKGARSVKVYSNNGTAAANDEIASMSWQMYQREGYGNTSDWRGGEYLSFWAKNASANEIAISYLDFYEGTFGPLTPTEPWRISGAYYTESDGTVTKQNWSGSVKIPANFSGRVIIPISSFSVPAWYTTGDGVLNPFRIVRADIGFVSMKGQTFPGTLYIDSISVLGDDMLQVDTLTTSSLQEMQLYGFESVDYEFPTLSFDAKLADSSFVKYAYESQGAYLGESSLSLKNVLTNQADGMNQYGGFGFSLYDQGESDSVDGKDYGNWTGAEYVGFWINNTNTTNVSFNVQCYENSPAGQPFAPTKCYQLSGFVNSKSVNYYTTNWHLVSEDGTVTTLAQNDFYIPAGFKGKVYIPLNTANFEVPSWQTNYTQPERLKLDRMARLNITFQPVNNTTLGIDKIYFDNFFVAGKSLAELQINDDSIYGNANAKFSLAGDYLPEGVYSSDLVTLFSILDEFDDDNMAALEACNQQGYQFNTAYRFNILDKTLQSVAFQKVLPVTLVEPANLNENTKMFRFADGKLTEVSYQINGDGTISSDFSQFGVFVFADVKAGSNTTPPGQNPPTGDVFPLYLSLAFLVMFLTIKALKTFKKIER